MPARAGDMRDLVLDTAPKIGSPPRSDTLEWVEPANVAERSGNLLAPRAERKTLGLGIAVDLARRHGSGIELTRLRARGTGLALVIPLETAAQPAVAAQSQ